jgi:hypothetical protein
LKLLLLLLLLLLPLAVCLEKQMLKIFIGDLF